MNTKTQRPTRRATLRKTIDETAMPTPQPRPCTTAQRAADIAGVSLWTIRKWAYEGRIASVKHGGAKSRLLIPLDELHRVIAESTRPAVSA